MKTKTIVNYKHYFTSIDMRGKSQYMLSQVTDKVTLKENEVAFFVNGNQTMFRWLFHNGVFAELRTKCKTSPELAAKAYKDAIYNGQTIQVSLRHLKKKRFKEITEKIPTRITTRSPQLVAEGIRYTV